MITKDLQLKTIAVCSDLLLEAIDDGRPLNENGKLLKQLLEILNKVKVEARWIQRVSNPYAWSVDKLANERRIEN